MSDEARINGGAGLDSADEDAPLGTDEDAPLGAAEAAAIMREQDARVRQAFRVSHRGAFAGWGAITLLGYGGTWLAVRHQQPVHGPDPIAFAVVSLLGVGVAMAAGAESGPRAGVGGVSALRRRVHALALLVGLGGMYTLEGALFRAGAGHQVLLVFEATAPILVAGLFYLTTSALSLDWALAGFGLWLAVAAVGGAFAGAAGVWGVDALTAGLGFLFMAFAEPRLHRPAELRGASPRLRPS
ncbi:MAG: hypothetical protein JO016_15035 [Actinobacteria bacterium]|nr:hypothetical protein [Actinomycetota bacterium]